MFDRFYSRCLGVKNITKITHLLKHISRMGYWVRLGWDGGRGVGTLGHLVLTVEGLKYFVLLNPLELVKSDGL